MTDQPQVTNYCPDCARLAREVEALRGVSESLLVVTHNQRAGRNGEPPEDLGWNVTHHGMRGPMKETRSGAVNAFLDAAIERFWRERDDD